MSAATPSPATAAATAGTGGSGHMTSITARAGYMMGANVEREWTPEHAAAWEGFLELGKRVRRDAEDLLDAYEDLGVSGLGILGRLARAENRTLRQTGLAEAVGRGLTGLLPIHGPFSLLVASTLAAALLSETTSNTASANMIVPVVISISQASGFDPLLPALGATMGSSLGFMLPVSSPCNAIVYGSGLVPLKKMMRHGVALDFAGALVVVAVVSLLGSFVS